VKII
jgi:serine/threonine protein kinase